MKKKTTFGMIIGSAAFAAVVLTLIIYLTGRQDAQSPAIAQTGDPGSGSTMQSDVVLLSEAAEATVAPPSDALMTSSDEVSANSAVEAASKQTAPRPAAAVEDVRKEIRERLLQGETHLEQADLVRKAGQLWREYWPASFEDRPPNESDDPAASRGTVPRSIRHSVDSSASVLFDAFHNPTNVGLSSSEARSLMALTLLTALGGADGCCEFLRERMMASEPNRGDIFMFHSINTDPRALASGRQLFLDDIRAFRDAQNPVYQLLAVRATLHAWSGKPGELSTESEQSGPIVRSARLAFLTPLLDVPDPFVKAQAKKAILSLGADEAIATTEAPR